MGGDAQACQRRDGGVRRQHQEAYQRPEQRIRAPAGDGGARLTGLRRAPTEANFWRAMTRSDGFLEPFFGILEEFGIVLEESERFSSIFSHRLATFPGRI
jgi:hypothetical protein